MGSACCSNRSGPTVAHWEGKLAARSGAWTYDDLDFINQPSLKIHNGPVSFDTGDGRGVQEQYEGRSPEKEMHHLVEHEKEAYEEVLKEHGLTTSLQNFPPATTEEEASRLLVSIRDGETKLYDATGTRVIPAVSKGIKGSSPLYVASMPSSDYDVYNHTLFLCLEERVGFGVVWEANWQRMWLKVWTMRIQEAVEAKKQLLVLTNDDGSLDFLQTIQAAWLKKRWITFRHMTASSFLLQGRPLLQAVKQERQELAEMLIGSSQVARFLQQRGYTGYAPLHALARSGQSQILEMALQAGADVSQLSFVGVSALHLASQEGHEMVVQHLINHGADVDWADSGGATSLWKACQQGHVEVVKKLLTAGASMHIAKRSNGSTPFFVTCEYGHEGALLPLLEHRADPDKHARGDLSTPLFIATQKGHVEVVSRLLVAKSDPDSARNDGVTPLRAALIWGGSRGPHVLELIQRAQREAGK